MRKLLIFIVVWTGLAGSIDLFAQPILGFGTPAVTVSSDSFNVSNGDSLVTYNFTIKNKGNQPLIGDIQILGRFNNNPTPQVLKAIKLDYVAAGDSVVYTATENLKIRATKYIGGDNIIVIWPHSENNGIQTVDTSQIGFYIDGYVGVKLPHGLDNRISIYPNPSSRIMNLKVLGENFHIEHVSLTNVLGQRVYDQESNVQELDCSTFDTGTYFLNIRYSDGIEETHRVHVLR